jgi:N6-L-threonylcarbamoyladenine synthase
MGIETSCDETSIGIVMDGRNLLSLQTYSQIELHTKHNGIVPEIASRSHLEKINSLIDLALLECNIKLKDLDYISVTNRPGLLGSLLVGVQTAKALALSLDKPLIPIDHLEAHLSIVMLENKFPEYPFLGLLLSGGNSAIFKVESPDKMKTIGDTLDDALGEAFDKVGILLGMGYPAGAEIEKTANKHTKKKGDVSIFPKILKENSEKIQFSYSGIKTSVIQYIKKNPEFKENLPKLCFDFQNSVFELVERNLLKAVESSGIKTVVAGGGVLANSTLRERLNKLANKHKFQFIYPEKKIYCTDNGAMVACQGFLLFQKYNANNTDFIISPSRENYNYETKA